MIKTTLRVSLSVDGTNWICIGIIIGAYRFVPKRYRHRSPHEISMLGVFPVATFAVSCNRGGLSASTVEQRGLL